MNIILRLSIPFFVCAIFAGCNYALDEIGALPKEAANKAGLKTKGTEKTETPPSEETKQPLDLDSAELSFVILKSEILEPKCLRCHTEENAKMTVLETYQDLKDNDYLTGAAEESLLYQVCVPGMAEKFMPPKRSKIPALDEKELSYLKRWLDAGSPE